MKNGKKPSREQRKVIERWGLKSADWLVERDAQDELVLVHRLNDRTIRVIPKERM